MEGDWGWRETSPADASWNGGPQQQLGAVCVGRSRQSVVEARGHQKTLPATARTNDTTIVEHACQKTKNKNRRTLSEMRVRWFLFFVFWHACSMVARQHVGSTEILLIVHFIIFSLKFCKNSEIEITNWTISTFAVGCCTMSRHTSTKISNASHSLIDRTLWLSYHSPCSTSTIFHLSLAAKNDSTI
jgi:hypothetical protein